MSGPSSEYKDSNAYGAERDDDGNIDPLNKDVEDGRSEREKYSSPNRHYPDSDDEPETVRTCSTAASFTSTPSKALSLGSVPVRSRTPQRGMAPQGPTPAPVSAPRDHSTSYPFNGTYRAIISSVPNVRQQRCHKHYLRTSRQSPSSPMWIRGKGI